jgi:predicted hotdog family 3-hydroxylacyl-ACP dehydratase
VVVHGHSNVDKARAVAEEIAAAGGTAQAIAFDVTDGAQAMAVHGGLRAREAGGAAKPGLLVALRAIELHVARIDDLPGPLDCIAEVLIDSDSGWQYAFRIHHGEALLAEGRAAVMLQAGDRA